MVTSRSLIPVLLLISIVLIVGCTSQNNTVQQPSCTPSWQCSEWGVCSRTGVTSGVQTRSCTDTNNCNIISSKPTESQTCLLLKIVTREPSKLALQVNDLPTDNGNWSIKERTERLKSDVSNDAISLGWLKGYYIRYARIGSQGLLDTTVLEQLISVYPIENVTKVIELPKPSDENYTIEELSKPNIGDDSRAFRITETSTGSRSYQIELVKFNIYELLYMSGTSTDYELLKEMATKAETKIS